VSGVVKQCWSTGDVNKIGSEKTGKEGQIQTNKDMQTQKKIKEEQEIP